MNQTDSTDLPAPQTSDPSGHPCLPQAPLASAHQHHEETLDDIPIVGPRPPSDDMVCRGLNSPIDELKKTAQFIDALRGASLEQSNMQQEDIDRLRVADPDPCYDVIDEHFLKALHLFLYTTNALRTTYNLIRSSLLKCYPDDPFLSFRQMKRCVEQLSGVVSIFYDMCRDTCVGFTGPFADCDQCPICSAFRFSPVRLFGSISNNRNRDRFIFLRYSPEPGLDHLTPVTSSFPNLLNRFKPYFMLHQQNVKVLDFS
jgi:hypothetical protein